MPLKTKPTTRMERRLTKEVSTLEASLKDLRSMYADLQATQRNHNEETTKLRQRIRQLESVPTPEAQFTEPPVTEKEIEKRIKRAVQDALETNRQARIMEATAAALFMAAKREFQTAEQIRGDAKKTETITPSAADVIESVAKNLYDLAVAYGNHNDPAHEY